MSIKRWASADDIDRTRHLHFFSRAYPTNLFFNLCSTLVSLGVHYEISNDEKMKLTFTREKPLNVWWEEQKQNSREDGQISAATIEG